MKTTNTTCTTVSGNQTTFTQSFDHVMCDKSQSLLGRLLYCRLARFVDNGKDAFPSTLWLAEEFGSNDKQVRVELNRLVDAGLINKKQRGLNQTNIYTVNPWPMDAFEAKKNKREERKEDFIEDVETQQEPPLEAPESLSNEVNTPNQPNTTSTQVKAVTELPRSSQEDENNMTQEEIDKLKEEAEFAKVPDEVKPSKRIDFGAKKEEEDIFGLW